MTSAPRSITEAADEKWQKEPVCHGLIEVAESRAEEKHREADFELTRDYWLKEFPGPAMEMRKAGRTPEAEMEAKPHPWVDLASEPPNPARKEINKILPRQPGKKWLRSF